MQSQTATPAAASPVLRIRPTNRSNLATPQHRVIDALQVVEELPRELVSAALKDAASLGYERVVIEGGEPLLYPGLPGLLTRARRLDLDTTLVTNGTLIGQARRWKAIAPLIDRLALTLHGLEAAHDAFVQRDGAFAQVIENLQIVRESNIPFGFVVSLTTDNVDALGDLVRLAAREGAASVEVHGSLDGGLGDDAIIAAVQEAAQLAGELGVDVLSDLVRQDELVLFRGRFVPGFPSRDLTDFAPTLIVESNGRLHPLSDDLPARLMLGSLHKARLAAFAPAWLASTRAAELAEAADRAWWELATPGGPTAVRWTSELALHVAAAPAARQAVAA
ncbi:MAG: radical SAM protein [Solirubrobacteraceae bacterium]|nr:radical SAM protein [Solirubrobacteraceae bacterium]